MPSWAVDDWKADIVLAQKAHIDGFALNMAYAEEGNDETIRKAFEAAEALGFKLIFSFDYAGGRAGPWPASVVTSFLQSESRPIDEKKRRPKCRLD